MTKQKGHKKLCLTHFHRTMTQEIIGAFSKLRTLSPRAQVGGARINKQKNCILPSEAG